MVRLWHTDIWCVSPGGIVARTAVNGFQISTLVMGDGRDEDLPGAKAAVPIRCRKPDMVDPAIAISIPFSADLGYRGPDAAPVWGVLTSANRFVLEDTINHDR
jgi:hypothetical protein